MNLELTTDEARLLTQELRSIHKCLKIVLENDASNTQSEREDCIDTLNVISDILTKLGVK